MTAAPIRRWLTAREAMAVARERYEAVVSAIRAGRLVGVDRGPVSGKRARFLVEPGSLDDWIRSGSPTEPVAEPVR